MTSHLRPPISRVHILLILTPALACLHPSRIASGESVSGGQVLNDTLLVQQAGLRQLLKTIDDHELGPLKTACLLIVEGDRGLGRETTSRNRPELEQFLQEE